MERTDTKGIAGKASSREIGRRRLLQTSIVAGGVLAFPSLFGGFDAEALAAPLPPGAPQVVPALKEFAPAAGSFRLAPAARIAAGSKPALGIAQTLAADLAEYLHRDVPQRSGPAQAGDIELVLDPKLRHQPGGQRFDEEGYRIEVGARVVITAPTATGLYWGTRTLLQQLAGAPDRATLACGTCHDWPDYPKRGFMLDVGRRFFSAEFLHDYLSLMSWFKLNEFQIHLMDNGFLERDPQTKVPLNFDWPTVQRGFRLSSDNPKFAGLASPDGAYDRRTWDALEDHAAARFVRIIPEIEGPAHALSVVGWKPELGLTGKYGDHLDLSKPEALQTMKDIFSEFIPWFRGTDIHIGADEYRADPELFRQYFNEISRHVRAHGKHPRAWGSFTQMSGGITGYDRDVTINCWNRDWYGMPVAQADGFPFINSDDDTLYVVPFADYFRGAGLNNRELYLKWVPSIGKEVKAEPGRPLGSMWAVWNDLTELDYNEFDVHPMLELSFPVMAQKNWNAAKPAVGFETFSGVVAGVGLGPARGRVKARRIGRHGDLMLDASVNASSEARGFDASHAIDREPATQWRAASVEPASFTVDLGAAMRVATLEIEWGPGQRLAYDVESSADGNRWTRVAARNDMTEAMDSIALSGDSIRQLRLSNIRGADATPSITRISAFASKPGNG